MTIVMIIKEDGSSSCDVSHFFCIFYRLRGLITPLKSGSALAYEAAKGQYETMGQLLKWTDQAYYENRLKQ